MVTNSLCIVMGIGLLFIYPQTSLKESQLMKRLLTKSIKNTMWQRKRSRHLISKLEKVKSHRRIMESNSSYSILTYLDKLIGSDYSRLLEKKSSLQSKMQRVLTRRRVPETCFGDCIRNGLAMPEYQ